MKISLIGIVMFLIGACCLDSENTIIPVCTCLTGLAIAFIGEKFFY